MERFRQLLADRVETAWDVNRIPDSRTPAQRASDRALHQLSRHYLVNQTSILFGRYNVAVKFNRQKIGVSTATDTPNAKTQLFPYASLYYFYYPLFNRG